MNMTDVCIFLPPDDQRAGLRFCHFVYEASYKRLHQPFLRNDFYVHLVYKGSAVLTTEGQSYPLESGTLFFTWPNQLYSMKGNNEFTYLYITFNGPEAETLLRHFGVTKRHSVWPNLEHLLQFWITSLRRITDLNAAVLTESVLLHSLSYLHNEEVSTQQDMDRFEKILRYIQHNYADPSLTITKVADMFFYSKKYFSALFVKNTGTRFSEYLNQLRIRHAQQLIRQGLSVSDVSTECGFSNASYFSKVFHRITGISPIEYRNQPPE